MLSEPSPIRIAILAGGQSIRMGSDKASLLVEGETLLMRTVRLAGAVLPDVPLVVGRTKPQDWPEGLSAEFVTDAFPGIGPLGGLLTALQVESHTTILALSCDLPALNEVALHWLLEQEPQRYGMITQSEGRYQPLFSLYTPATLPLIESNRTLGKRSLHALIEAGGDGFALRDIPLAIAMALINVNTPEEWERFHRKENSSSPV